LGAGAGLSRQQVQAAYGERAAWLLVELQQLAAVERTLLVNMTQPDGLSKGETELGLSLFTSQRTQSGSSQSLILFLSHKAAQLRWNVAKSQDGVHEVALLGAASLARDVYAPLANLLGLGKIKDELEDSAFALTHAEERARVRAALGGGGFEDLLRQAADQLRAALQPGLELTGMGSEGAAGACDKRSLDLSGVTSLRVTGRTKSAYSVWRKMRNKGRLLHEVLDCAAMRVILDAETAAEAERLCYRVRDVAMNLWPTLKGKEKDYIANPKSNGYRSLHIVLQKDGLPFELQIRTENMHKQAEHGSSGHWEYKAMGAQGGREAFRSHRHRQRWADQHS